jgi:hypothetical protein
MTEDLTVVEPTPMGLIAAAIEHGADPDKLEKLMGLQERWEDGQAEKAYATALHAAQAEMPVVVRDAANTQTRSKYALLETVQRTYKPISQAHGLALSFGEEDCPLAGHKRTSCDVRHVDGACHTYHLDLPVDGIGPKGNAVGGMNAVQGAISTTSYAQRRLVCMIFNITIADEDTDGNGPVQLITQDQLVVLNTIVDKLPVEDTKVASLLKYADVASLDLIPADKFEIAKRGLEQRAGQYERGEDIV